MKTNNWEKEWSEFVIKEMCPARCGHLRFKLKQLLEKLLNQQRQDIIKEIEKIEKDKHYEGDDCEKCEINNCCYEEFCASEKNFILDRILTTLKQKI